MQATDRISDTERWMLYAEQAQTIFSSVSVELARQGFQR